MTRDDRPTLRDRGQAPPDAVVERADETAPVETGSAESTAPDDSTRKPFNPWHFGFHTVSAEHRRELLEMQLPETPAERLFDPRTLDSKPDASGSAPPALSVDTDDDTSDGSAGRKADTLRLRRGPPLIHPLRLAAPWAAGAALIVIALLWLLSGKRDPQRPDAAVATPPTGTPATLQRTAVRAEPRPEAAPASAPTSTGVANHAATEAAKPEGAAKRPEARKATQTAKVPAVAPVPTPATVTPLPSAKKPAAPNDDASPFGTWTAPPRD